MKLLLTVVLLYVLLSLAWWLSKWLRGESDASAGWSSLPLRIALSASLCLLLFIGAILGCWRPHQRSTPPARRLPS